MRKVVFALFIFCFSLFLTPYSFGYDVLFLGNLSEPPGEVALSEAALVVDLGGHELSDEEWFQLATSRDNWWVLPSFSELEERFPLLEQFSAAGIPIIATDSPTPEPVPTFSSFLTYTQNYHTLAALNLIQPSSPDSLAETLESLEAQNPDNIVVVGGEDALSLYREELSPWQEKTEFINREELSADFVQVSTLPEKPVVLFFYSSRCPECRKLKNEITPPVFEKYQDQIKLVYLDYMFSENYQKLVELEEAWQVEKTASVEIFSPAGYLIAEDPSTINQSLESFLEETIAQFEAGKKKVITDLDQEGESLILRRFQGFTPWVVAVAGLLDGFNPCAFATIIFLANLLMVLGHNRQRVLQVGVTYSLTVFVTYLLLGLGIFEIWQTLSAYQLISRVIYGAMAALLLVFAVLSIKDAIQYRKTKKETEMSLGLPKSWRLKINQYLKQSFSQRRLIVAAILSGFVISLIEAGCTGQIYLPTIMYIARESAYRLEALPYLLLYNLFFIIPLVAVFLGIFWGSQSQALVQFGRKNIFFSKLALAGLFLVLSAFLWQGALA